MKNIKKASLYISLLILPSILSGCGTVEHVYYRSSSKSTSKVPSVSLSLPPEQVSYNMESFFASNDSSVDIPLEEFGPDTNLRIERSSRSSESLVITGEVYNYDFRLDVLRLVSLYLYDANEDGYRDLCITSNNRQGNSIFIYDLKKEGEIFYLEPIRRSDNSVDSYSFSLDGSNMLYAECSSIVNSRLNSEYGVVSYSSNYGVYVDWKNYLNVSGFMLTIRGSDGAAIISSVVRSTVANVSTTLSRRKSYSFFIKPLEDVDAGEEYMHFAYRNSGVTFNPTTFKLSEYSEEADGKQFCFSFSYSQNTNDNTNLTVHFSGYSLNLNLYIPAN